MSDVLSRGRDLYSLGFWREAQAELAKCKSGVAILRWDDAVVNEEVDYLSAMCDAHLGDGAQALKRFVENHPNGRFTHEALWALGEEHHEWRRWAEAVNEYPQPHPGKEWQPDQIDPGGICHCKALHAKSRKSIVP